MTTDLPEKQHQTPDSAELSAARAVSDFVEARNLDPMVSAKDFAPRDPAAAAEYWKAVDGLGVILGEASPQIPDAGETLSKPLPRGQGSIAKPERIGSFKILDVLGEGGMGIVYLAEQDKPIHRRVALKIIKLGMDTKQVIARFETEREALALMNHPNVAKVFDAGTTEQGRPYFAMEYVPGIPITGYCDKHRLSTEERLRLFMDVCHAVQHAHQKGIIHRDIKPSNVLVSVQDERAVPKVIDFGVAKATQKPLTELTLYTEQGQLIGTPGYMSPEQAEMTILDIDTRTDIYSLGVMLYELLVGARPFEDRAFREAGLAEIQRIIREVDPPKPSTKLSSLRSEPRTSVRADSDAVETKPRTSVRADSQSLDTARAKARGSIQDIARLRHTEPKTLIREIRGDLDWIVMKCLEKDRTRRYDTANALAMEIERYLRHEPVSAGPPSAVYRVRKFVRRNRAAVMAVTAIILVLATGLIGTSVMYVRAAAAERRERSERTRAEAALVSEAEQRQIAQANEQRARDEADRAEKEAERARIAQNEAEQRSKELEQVAEFQASQLSGIDTERMGLSLRRGIIDKRRVTLAARGLEEQAVEASLGELESALSGVNFTNLALETLDENIFERALKAIEKDFAGQPLVKARLLQTVADTLRELGVLNRATKPQEEALTIRRETLGNDHPDTLISIDNLGELLLYQGKWAEAETYFREALAGRRSVHGDDHQDTLESIDNMGVLLTEQGKLAEAETYYREALVGRRRVLGDDHPSTLVSVSNMGYLLEVQGKLAEAELYYREALAGRRRVLGDDHPSTLSSIADMAMLLDGQGKPAEAETYLREALAGKRRVLGDDHPTTLSSIANMAVLLSAHGRHAEAEPYFREALAGYRRVLGDDHMSTVTSIHNMGLLLSRQGKPAEAEPYFREAVAGSRRALGDDHPNTLFWIQNLAWALHKQGKSAEAETHLREVLAGCRRVSDDSGAVLSLCTLGALVRDLGRYAEAEALGAEGVQRARDVLPAGDLLTADCLFKHGRTLAALERFAEAEAESLEAHEIFATVMGKDDERTTKCVESLVALYESWDAAEPGKGYDAKAAEWRAKLDEFSAKGND